MPHDLIIIQVSFPPSFNIESLCKTLIQSKLAVCIHEFPSITSHYEWRAKIETSQETIIHIKTSNTHFSAIESLILSKHPYDVPELFSIPIDQMSTPYLKWANQTLSNPHK